MKPDLDWMDMFTIKQSDYTDAGLWMECQSKYCLDSIYPDKPAVNEPTLGDLYIAGAKHIKEEHEC